MKACNHSHLVISLWNMESLRINLLQDRMGRWNFQTGTCMHKKIWDLSSLCINIHGVHGISAYIFAQSKKWPTSKQWKRT